MRDQLEWSNGCFFDTLRLLRLTACGKGFDEQQEENDDDDGVEAAGDNFWSTMVGCTTAAGGGGDGAGGVAVTVTDAPAEVPLTISFIYTQML